MTEPIIAQKAPYPVEVEAGLDYYWYSCGRSNKQPFCDGSYKDTGMKPAKFKAEQTGTVYFCGCKHSKKGPLCYGTHTKLWLLPKDHP